MASETRPMRPASTVLLLRKGETAPVEVFMMVRHYQIEFASGALVFPGGSVDAADRAIVENPKLYAGVAGLDAETLAFRVGAIRETFEESGILLARLRGDDGIIPAAKALAIANAEREALCADTVSFADIVIKHDLVLALDLLLPYAHWITPEGLPKRFDTWFFLAEAPPEQLGAHDGRESTDSIWLSPQEALNGKESGRFTLPFPTTRNLIRLGKQESVASALTHARAMNVVTVMPIMSRDGDKRTLRIPAEAGYDGEVFEFDGA
jgi:8-oxo-dGTP pyrophosphatase MutT (NUDIX family)